MSELTSLNHLLKATSKSIIEKVLAIVFATRAEGSEECVEFLKTSLSLDSDSEGEELRLALLKCIQTPLASGSIESLAELFQESGTDVNPKLKSLVGQIVNARLESWKEAAAMSRVSLPRLVDVDWTLHMQRASSQVSQMQVPVALISLEVEDQPTTVGVMPPTKRIDFELSKEALETMLDGLGKIRDQLAVMG